jgi:hypothetical protein
MSLVACLVYSSTLMMETVCFSKKFMKLYQARRHHTLEYTELFSAIIFYFEKKR